MTAHCPVCRVTVTPTRYTRGRPMCPRCGLCVCGKPCGESPAETVARLERERVGRAA